MTTDPTMHGRDDDHQRPGGAGDIVGDDASSPQATDAGDAPPVADADIDVGADADDVAQTPWAVAEDSPAAVGNLPGSDGDELPLVELSLDRTDGAAVAESRVLSETEESSPLDAVDPSGDPPPAAAVQQHLPPDELLHAPAELTPVGADAHARVREPATDSLDPQFAIEDASLAPLLVAVADAPSIPAAAAGADEFDMDVEAVPDDVASAAAVVSTVFPTAAAQNFDAAESDRPHDAEAETAYAADGVRSSDRDDAPVVAYADASTPQAEEVLDAEADEIDPEPELVGSAPVAGGMWTIPMLCLGIAIIACCVLIPQTDYNRRLAYEREKLRRDVDAITEQVKVNDEFLRKLAEDPTLAERLAQRQMKIVRQGTRVLDLKSRGYEETEMSPFHLVTVPPPDPLPPFQARGGVLTQACLNPHTRLYLIGGALILMASGLVLGYAPRRG